MRALVGESIAVFIVVEGQYLLIRLEVFSF